MSLSDKRKTSNSYKDNESDIISFDDLSDGVYLEKDVKEFIKKLKEELKTNCLVYPQIIKKLAGDGLLK